MLSIVNDLSYNTLRRKKLGGTVTGVWKDEGVFHGLASFPLPQYPYVTATFPDFEKLYVDDPANPEYHLSGYGLTLNESLVSFLGESIERFSFATAEDHLMQFVVNHSYNYLKDSIAKEDVILDLEYINIITSEENSDHYLYPEDEIQWIKLPRLVKNGYTYIPLQFFIPRRVTEEMREEKNYTPGAVSTGTACHETFERSIENAIIEYIQIDSFNMWWYGGQAGEVLDFNIREYISYIFGEPLADQMLSKFNITFTDISFDKPIHIILCEIESKNGDTKIPQYVVGLQGGFNFKSCLYRALLECLTVVEYAYNFPWINAETYKNVTKNIGKITNLDDNVIYYAKYGKPHDLVHEKTIFSPVEKVNSLSGLLDYLKDRCPSAGFTGITPTGIGNYKMVTSRISIPELLPVCLPSIIPANHPRYKQIGGVRNRHPHPLA